MHSVRRAVHNCSVEGVEPLDERFLSAAVWYPRLYYVYLVSPLPLCRCSGFLHRYSYNVNYTWMKSTDTTSCEGQFCNDNIQNWGTGAPQLLGGNRKLEHSISVYDIPSVFRFNYNWDLPTGKGKLLGHNAPGWLNQFIGNWKLSKSPRWRNAGTAGK